MFILRLFIAFICISITTPFSYAISIPTSVIHSVHSGFVATPQTKINIENAPIDNSHFKVVANSIFGSRVVLESNACWQVVEFLKNRISPTPIVIMDGGYSVEINNNIVLQSSHDSLYSWINRCSEKHSQQSN